MTSSFFLSTKGFRNLTVIADQDDFTFIIGSVTYSCPSYFAEFLSPRISQLRSIDSTFTEFIFETTDQLNVFPQILSIGRGCELSISDSNRSFILSIARELANAELCEKIANLCPIELNLTTVVKRLHFCDDLGIDFTSEIEFAASHFSELSEPELTTLNFEIISAIFESPSLKSKDEDELYHFVITQGKVESNYYSLLNFLISTIN
jgi:hypothetical protein